VRDTICVWLTLLALADNQIRDEGAKALAEALKTNETVTHMDLFGVIANDCVWLTLLALADNQIRDEGAKALAEALKTNKSVTSIDFCSEKCVMVRLVVSDWRCLVVQAIELAMKAPKQCQRC
jgi:Ran GTPase-activating protein (RanGAP) involved in mRNA processing and transport